MSGNSVDPGEMLLSVVSVLSLKQFFQAFLSEYLG